MIGNLLAAVRVFLPNINREGGGRASDYLPDPTTLAHLRRRFNHVCSTLLRNDSLADMSERSVLYFELLEWLEVVSFKLQIFLKFMIICRPSPTTKHLPA
jgi:hypothetical protein